MFVCISYNSILVLWYLYGTSRILMALTLMIPETLPLMVLTLLILAPHDVWPSWPWPSGFLPLMTLAFMISEGLPLMASSLYDS